MFKVNTEDTKTTSLSRSDALFTNFKHTLRLVLVFLLLNMSCLDSNYQEVHMLL